MPSVIHKAEDRGHANHGWLNTYHNFSIASYYNPERMNFGVLRVLNDDTVAPGMGFGRHAHDNMEIISIPLSGDLEHRDSMGNVGVIREGDIQVMSAGSGIHHSEYNKNKDQEVKFLQIWLFPDKKNVEPRYDQQKIEISRNKLHQILSPDPEDAGVWIHQKAWFSMGRFDAGKEIPYHLKQSANGIYIFVLEGSIQVEGKILGSRDAIGIWETHEIDISFVTDAKILLMDIPMALSDN